ncbi:aspartate kinase [Membranihabitans maritimus]|uniref:aspartate kinase n=1 Tax=Membranihabitans maritimus TaxID=2904244 RepID=UPI001F030F57|nr:aspartate kinase [Membranihabitans maritimus]
MVERVVYKFGGASVKDADSIRNVGNIIGKCDAVNIIVVVSAMGKSTNALEKVVEETFEQTGKGIKLLLEIKKEHNAVVNDLGLERDQHLEELNNLFSNAENFLHQIKQDVHSYDFIYDQIVSLGELCSTRIIASYLNQKTNLKPDWIDSRKVIRTDNTYREGRVNWNETSWLFQKSILPRFKDNKVLLTQGFLGGDENGNTVTLGREGSDYSAAIFSYCTDADYMAIWKDVPGILTADPKLFENVSLIDKLSYLEAIEMTYYGAKVIHPKTIKPLQNKNIPLWVKSFEDSDSVGTLISGTGDLRYPPVVVVEKNQRLLFISTKDLSFVAEHHLSKLFELFSRHRIKVNLMRNTAISFTVCVTDRPDRINAFLSEISQEFDIEDEKNLELITIRHYQEPVVDAIKKGKIVLFEERIPKTVQLVLKALPLLKRKDD